MKRNIISSVLGLLVLTIGTGMGIFLVQSKQIFSEKAAEPDTTAVKIAEIAKEVGESSSNSSLSTYTSDTLGYALNFDKNYWIPTSPTNLNQPNLSSMGFVLNSNAGAAQVNFTAHDKKELDARIVPQKAKNPNLNADDLDLLANSIKNETRPVASEKVNRNGRNYYKFAYESSFLNQKSKYYEYVTIAGGNYYTITAKYSSFGDGAILSEKFIDSFTFTPSNSSVKGISTKAKTTTILDESKIVELTKPSVVQIAHLFCNKVSIPDLSGLKYLKSNYTICDGALGSGFVINKDGYVATNGHVTVQYPGSSLLGSILNSNPFVEPFMIELIQEVVLIETGQEIPQDQAKTLLAQTKNDPTYFESFARLIYKLVQQNVITLNVDQEKYYVKLANQPLNINSEKVQSDFVNSIAVSESVKEAKLIAFDYPDPLSIDVVLNSKPVYGTDVAIIKIEDLNGLVFPAVNVGSSDDLKSGSDIIVIGYPGLVSSSGSSGLVDEQSSATPTITRGVVSAIKNDQAGNKLIQVDASIDHGNSGGPAFDINGNVIGIATYGVGSQSGNYNFLRDVADLKKLADSNSVTIESSPTYNEWEAGLNYFWTQHYKQAAIPFNKVQTDYPVHPEIADYISDSESAIKNGQDKSEFLFLLKNDQVTQLKVGGGFLGLVVVAGVIVFFIKRRSSQNQIPSSVPQTTYPVASEPPVVQSQTPAPIYSQPTPSQTTYTPIQTPNPVPEQPTTPTI